MRTRSLLTALKSWRSVTGPRRPYRRPNIRLGLEALDDRCVPAVLPVTSTLDDATHPGTLRYAVAHADDGDTIAFTQALQGAPIVLTQGELLLEHDVIIEPMFDGVQIISGGGTSRVFELSSAAQVTLSDLTITNGNGVGNNPLTMDHDGLGGGVLNFGTLTIADSTLAGNSAYDGGGVLSFGTLTVAASTLTGNAASHGAGGIGSFGPLTVTASALTNNTAVHGGGIWSAGPLSIADSTLAGNAAAGGSGGAIVNNGPATVVRSSLTGNAADFGGGIWNGATGVLNLAYSTVTGNAALLGADLFNLGWVTVDDSIVGDRYDG